MRSDVTPPEAKPQGVDTAHAHINKQRDTEAETGRMRLLAEKCDATTTVFHRTEEVSSDVRRTKVKGAHDLGYISTVR